MIWRLLKDFKSDIVFSACFAYDIDSYYIYIPHARICKKVITNVSHVHNIASQTINKVYFETFQSLRLINKVIRLNIKLELSLINFSNWNCMFVDSLTDYRIPQNCVHY